MRLSSEYNSFAVNTDRFSVPSNNFFESIRSTLVSNDEMLIPLAKDCTTMPDIYISEMAA